MALMNLASRIASLDKYNHARVQVSHDREVRITTKRIN